MADDPTNSSLWTTIYVGAGALLTAIGAVLNQLLQNTRAGRLENRKDNREDFQLVRDGLHAQVVDLRAEITDLRKECSDLKIRITHLETICERDLPIPQWTKDRDGRFQWVSEAFSREILAPLDLTLDRVIGKYDTDVWGEEIRKVLAEIDKQSLASPTRSSFAAGVFLGGQPGLTWSIYKWPLMRMGIHIGWAGLAVPERR